MAPAIFDLPDLAARGAQAFSLLLGPGDLVFQPGTPSAAGHVATSAEVIAELPNLPPTAQIVVDDRLAPAEILPGQRWRLDNSKYLRGWAIDRGCRLHVLDGGIIEAPAGNLSGLTVVGDCVTVSALELGLPAIGGNSTLLTAAGAHWERAPGAAVPLASCVPGPPGSGPYILAFLLGSGLGGAFPFFDVLPGATLAYAIAANFGGSPFNDSVTGPPGASFFQLVDASQPVITNVGFFGALGLMLIDRAPSVGYDPGAPANWVPPLPTTVQEALDRLAAAGGVVPVP